MGSCCSKRTQSVTDHAFPEKNQPDAAVFKLQVPVSTLLNVSNTTAYGFQENALQKLRRNEVAPAIGRHAPEEELQKLATFDAAILGSLTVVIPTNHPPFELDESLEHTSDPCETEDESQESGELGETMDSATIDVISEAQDAGRSRELDTSHDFTPENSKCALEGLALGKTREMFHESSNSIELDEMEIDRNSGVDIAGHGPNFDALKNIKEEDHSDDNSVSDDLIIMALRNIQHFGTFSSNVSAEMKDADNGNSDATHITLLEDGSHVKTELETADEQVLLHTFFRNTDPLHAYGSNAAHEPHNFLVHQINRSCEDSKKLPLHNEIVLPSSSEKFITSELPTSPNSYASQGPEKDLRLDDIGYGGFSNGARISFSWDCKENEACHSDCETFEFQPTNEFHQSSIKRTEQLQEAEESYEFFLSQEKRGSDLFEYKYDSFTGVCSRENAELVSESSGLFDLCLGRELISHDGCESLKQERSERDKYGSTIRQRMFSDEPEEYELTVASSSTEVAQEFGNMQISPTKHDKRTGLDSIPRINSYNHLQDTASTLSIEDIMNLLEKEELDEDDLVSMLINAKASCQASDVTSESSFEFKIKSADSTPHSTPSTPMFSASSTPRRISQLNTMALTPEEIAEIWGVFESSQTFSSC